MALATTCPHCKTSFKVVADQLKLRRGLVRCGKCQEVFSGVDYLRYIDDPKPKPPAPVAIVEPLVDLEDLKTAFFLPETIFNASLQIDPMTIQAPVPAYIPSPLTPPSSAFSQDLYLKVPPGGNDTSTRAARPSTDSDSTFISRQIEATDQDAIPSPGFSAVEAAALKLSRIPQGLEIEPIDQNPSSSRSASSLNSDFNAQQLADQQIATHGEVSAIDYLVKPSGQSKLWLLACAGLFVLAIFQGLILGRNELAIQYPNLRPLLTQISQPLGLRVELPRRFDSLTIESFELQVGEASGGETQIYTAQALLRNQATHAVQWPAIELSLTDPAGQLLARKVLLSSDYLSPTEQKDQGFAARSEKNIRVRLSLNQLTPNGYSAVLFYP